ncbi:MAG: lipopolysaccharide biosynthesis protein, partial [Bacteroidales bacterium]|nr:lipopolysaccharide biosynthesis protein [Bacteroidales bacterium]
ILSYFVGQKKAPIPYDLKSAFLYFAIAIGLFFAQRYIQIDNKVWTLIINTGLLMVFFAFICWKEKDLVNSVIHVVNNKILKKK